MGAIDRGTRPPVAPQAGEVDRGGDRDRDAHDREHEGLELLARKPRQEQRSRDHPRDATRQEVAQDAAVDLPLLDVDPAGRELHEGAERERRADRGRRRHAQVEDEHGDGQNAAAHARQADHEGDQEAEQDLQVGEHTPRTVRGPRMQILEKRLVTDSPVWESGAGRRDGRGRTLLGGGGLRQARGPTRYLFIASYRSLGTLPAPPVTGG
jgi:hypothetical protein